MLLADGVDVIETKDHLLASQHLLDLALDHRAGVYVVNAYDDLSIFTPEDLIRALAESMAVSEWFGYSAVEIFAQCLNKSHRSHVVALILQPHHMRVAESIVHALQQAHRRALSVGKSFWTLIFTSPIHLPAPRI